MTLDIRLPMGLLFALLGGLLVIHGLLTGAVPQGPAAGFNINAWWGAVLIVFGIAMLSLAARSAKHSAAP